MDLVASMLFCCYLDAIFLCVQVKMSFLWLSAQLSISLFLLLSRTSLIHLTGMVGSWSVTYDGMKPNVGTSFYKSTYFITND